MHEIEIAGHSYRFLRMDLKMQSHLSRRLFALVDKVAPDQFKAALSEGGVGNEEVLLPLLKAISGMEDAQFDAIIDPCMKHIQRRAPGGAAWSPVMISNGKVMFEDITVPIMIRLTLEAVRTNLGPSLATVGDALSGLFGSSQEEAQPNPDQALTN